MDIWEYVSLTCIYFLYFYISPTTQIPSQDMDWHGGRFIHLQSELPQVGIVSVPIEVHDHYTMAPFKQNRVLKKHGLNTILVDTETMLFCCLLAIQN